MTKSRKRKKRLKSVIVLYFDIFFFKMHVYISLLVFQTKKYFHSSSCGKIIFLESFSLGELIFNLFLSSMSTGGWCLNRAYSAPSVLRPIRSSSSSKNSLFLVTNMLFWALVVFLTGIMNLAFSSILGVDKFDSMGNSYAINKIKKIIYFFHFSWQVYYPCSFVLIFLLFLNQSFFSPFLFLKSTLECYFLFYRFLLIVRSFPEIPYQVYLHHIIRIAFFDLWG